MLPIVAALDTGLGDGANRAIVNAVMLVILAFPLGFTPILMKIIGGISSQVGGMVNNRSKGVFDRTRNLGRNLSKKQTGAIKGGIKGGVGDVVKYQRGKLAANADPNERRSKRYARQVLTTGKIFGGQRNRLAVGAMGEKFEDEEISMAKKSLVQRGVHRNKSVLADEARNGKDPYARFAAAQMLGEEGGVQQLRDMYEGGDPELRMIAAKAMASSKTMSQQGNIYTSRAQEYLDHRQAGETDAQALTSAQNAGNAKVNNKATAEFVLSQKVWGAKPGDPNDHGPSSFKDMEATIGGARLRDLLAQAQKNPQTAKNFSAGHQAALDDLVNRLGPPPPPPP